MKKNKKLILMVALLVVLLAGAGAVAFQATRAKKTQSMPGINLGPATADDKKRAEATKQKIENQQNNANGQSSSGSSSNPSALKTVTPVITYAGQYSGQVQVGARVSGLVESTGTCQAVLTMNGVTLKKQVNAVQNASSMDCPEMDFASTDTTPGTWSVTVSYNSTTASGSSSGQTFEVH